MKQFINNLYLLIASGFGIGFISCRMAGGLKRFSFINVPERWTGAGLFGSVLGCFFVYFGLEVHGISGLFWLTLATFFSFHIAGKAERILQYKDPPQIVIDEIIGLFWAVACLPASAFDLKHRFIILLSAFLLFRVFDVLKLPFSRAQNFRGGLGVVMDDLFAGLFANIILQAIVRWNGFILK